MLIRVRYTTGTYDYVSRGFLSDLIQGSKISQFLRSSGWATIGIDPIRECTMTGAYAGPERRGKQKILSLGLALAKPILKKGLYAALIGLVLIASTLFGTALSAIFCPPVSDIEDPYSAEVINVFGKAAAR
jgi:hypothetical protein